MDAGKFLKPFEGGVRDPRYELVGMVPIVRENVKAESPLQNGEVAIAKATICHRKSHLPTPCYEMC
jgi:hypothetical protein